MKRRYKNESEIPAEHKDLYKKEGDWWVLQIELDQDDDFGNSRLSEFRQTNIKLEKQIAAQKKQHEELMKSLSGVDVSTIPELMKVREQLEQNEELKLLSEGKFDVVRDRWTGGLKKTYEGQLNEAKKKAEAAEQNAQKYFGKLKSLKLNQHILEQLDAMGVRPMPGATRDIFARAGEVFDLDEEGNEVVPRSQEGGPDGKAWTPSSWVSELVNKDATYLFEKSSGGGAAGSKKTTNSKGVTWIDNTPENLGKYEKEILAGKVKVRGLDVE